MCFFTTAGGSFSRETRQTIYGSDGSRIMAVRYASQLVQYGSGLSLRHDVDSRPPPVYLRSAAGKSRRGRPSRAQQSSRSALSLYIYISSPPPPQWCSGDIGRPNTLARLLRDCRRKTQSTPKHSQNLTSLPPRLLLALRPPSAWQPPPPPTEGQERRGRARPTPGGSAPIACPSVSGEPAFGPPSASAVARERRPEMRRRNESKTHTQRKRDGESYVRYVLPAASTASDRMRSRFTRSRSRLHGLQQLCIYAPP